ncbi:hypothetical protein HPP92_014528 [Vanilla planifolia]|uniref:LOB domain-containing protein n=1 Tax=Vanilla planifolia TaxID=51239 RepID=A0A835QU22_VANPL|nr:hypothetical protein HPP92_014528 [Vanilla planifolia]
MSTGSTSGSAGGSAGAGGSGGGGGSSGPCGACKFLRRKCVTGCIFAPYFDSEQGAAHFAAVHKVFGASNVSKLLLHIPAHKRLDAVVTICYEAQSRLRDPVYGCVAHIFALQQQVTYKYTYTRITLDWRLIISSRAGIQVVSLQAELSYLQTHLATMELPTPPPPPQLSLPQTHSLSMPDLLSSAAATVPASTLDLSTLFDPQSQQAAELHPPQQLGRGGGGGDLQALARELIDRHRSSASNRPPMPKQL